MSLYDPNDDDRAAARALLAAQYADPGDELSQRRGQHEIAEVIGLLNDYAAAGDADPRVVARLTALIDAYGELNP